MSGQWHRVRVFSELAHLRRAVKPRGDGPLQIVAAGARKASVRLPGTLVSALLRSSPMSLIAVSGAECVEALVLAGFVVRGRTEGATAMTKGLRVVLVPDVAVLPPQDLSAILKRADLAYSRFLDLLSEAPTDPAISRTRPAAAR